MALRLLEIVISSSQSGTARDLLEDLEPHRLWQAPDSSDSETSILKALVDAEDAEPIMDALQQRFGDSEQLNVVLLPVEAALPRAKKDQDQTPSNKKKRRDRRVSREELYTDLSERMEISPDFLTMVALAAIVAAIGLLRSNAAIVIGAMVVAPLLRPNVSLALASTLGDVSLARAAMKLNAAGLFLTLGLSAVGGFFFGVDPDLSEIQSRTTVGAFEVILGFAAGSAGALAYAGGLPSVLTGVMVAVALLPPSVASGLLLGAGHLELATRAFLLLLANIICVNLAGVIVFLLKGVRPRTWWETRKARKATRDALLTWGILLAALIIILALIPKT